LRLHVATVTMLEGRVALAVTVAMGDVVGGGGSAWVVRGGDKKNTFRSDQST
jgi:hypothetical protein